jgi:hypothetical protein
MNVEMIQELQQLKSNLARAHSIAERQLRDPSFDPIGISSNLLKRIVVVTQDIDDIITTEEEALEDYYQKSVTGKDAPLFQSASSNNGTEPEYTITIQPQGYTPNEILLTLKSLGYLPAFKSMRELASSAWADFYVSRNGLAFELSSTVESIQPPELERYDEPATDDDDELPF